MHRQSQWSPRFILHDGREYDLLAFGLLAAMLLAPNLGVELAMLTPLCSVPLAFAGLALLHGLGLSRF